MIYACRYCRAKIKHDDDAWEDVGIEYFSKLMRKASNSAIKMDYCPECIAELETRRLKKIVERADKDVKADEDNRLRLLQDESEKDRRE